MGSWAHFRNRQLLAYRTYPHFGMESPLPVVWVLSFGFAISRKTRGSLAPATCAGLTDWAAILCCWWQRRSKLCLSCCQVLASTNQKQLNLLDCPCKMVSYAALAYCWSQCRSRVVLVKKGSGLQLGSSSRLVGASHLDRVLVFDFAVRLVTHALEFEKGEGRE